ncbi:Ran GTPase-activating protein (RanGAP) involved in mRNA processing and transport [Hamadaea flava]|uniref:Gala protein n=1 Tax=Hamadaea flava TaxID=1742688 RepID=A0ABV8M343_9ACTN|nr:gala protein [Hamadaea flava]MCP2328408.1 Ran GTPase-activating protein (RanGAP) involved in mRNA processing and transport [Hamadaea flava]
MQADGTPTPVRCPVITDPTRQLADPDDFVALLDRLGQAAGATEAEVFPRGTIQPDGRLDLCKQGVGPMLTARLAKAAAESGAVRHLLLGTNNLGAQGAQAVADALRPGHHLRTLYLGCNRIDADAVAPLADRLATDDTVRALWLKRNPIGDEGVARICSALAVNTTLRTLDLVNVGLSVDGLRHLTATLVGRSVKLDRLFLGGNGLTADAAPLLATLVRDAGIHELYLACNHLGDAGAQTLAEAADGRPMTIGLGANGLTPAGTAALAEHLTAWRVLDLGRPPSERALLAVPNEVGDTGAAALAQALPSAQLRRLDLRRTGVGGRGARLLVAAAENHPTLAYLGLRGGVPRRMRRKVAAELPGRDTIEIPEDVRAIASVYR